MLSTDTNGGHQVISHFRIAKLPAPSNLITVKEYLYVNYLGALK